MATVVWWIFILAVLAALAAGAAVLIKAYMSGASPSAVFFKPRPEPRLEVVEHANLDGKRKLVLIRRDDVEHLIMTGGPVDVVIETGIGEAPKRAAEPLARPAPTVFTRPPRAFGTATPAAAAAEDEADLALKRSALFLLGGVRVAEIRRRQRREIESPRRSDDANLDHDRHRFRNHGV